MSREQGQALDAKLRGFSSPFGTRSIQEQRDGFVALMNTMRVPAGIHTTAVELAGIRTLRIEPTAAPRPGTILFFHGGSFIVGSPETQLGLTGNLVVRTGYTAYSVDSRLAPEHPFPAAIDDTTAAYRALLEAGHDPASVAFSPRPRQRRHRREHGHEGRNRPDALFLTQHVAAPAADPI